MAAFTKIANMLNILGNHGPNVFFLPKFVLIYVVTLSLDLFDEILNSEILRQKVEKLVQYLCVRNPDSYLLQVTRKQCLLHFLIS